MALTSEQLLVASDAFQADVETNPLESASGLSLTDLQALYSHLQDDTATAGDLQSFLSESKTYSSTDSWAKYDLDSRVMSVGFKAQYTPESSAMAHAALESPTIGSTLSNAYDSVKGAAKSGYSAVKNAVSAFSPKPITDWFSTLFGWVKWIVIAAVAILVLYVVYKVAALLK